MKKIYNIALLASLALMGATSCIHDDLDYIGGYEQNAGDLELTFVVEDSEIVTRAAQSTYYEHAVQSIYVFVFNGDKRVELPDPDNPDDEKNGNINFFDLDEIQDEHNKQDDADTDNSHGTLRLGTVSGSNMRICAIANIGTSNSVTRAEISTAVSEQVEKFDAITTYTQLKELVLELGAESVQRGSSFLLTGEVTGVTLKANDTTEVEILLYRTDAKVTFNVTAANDGLEDFKFIPQRWRVVNVPKATWALPRENLTGETIITIGDELDATADNLFFDSTSAVFEGKVNGADNSGTFTFYMYENLKGAKANAATYAMRELQEKTDVDSVADYDPVPGQKYVNGDYVNAPERGTYVVFSGQLSYTHKAVDANNNQYDEFVMADVEYCVHLGHLSQSNFDDYKTLRNHHYTYNVTVTGVNDLIVEVENGGDDPEERRPGAEGEVVMSASKVVAVDGHYDRALITLTPEEAKNILFAVKTPWERGLDTNNYYVDQYDNPTNANTLVRDYKWVKFLINKDYDIADTEFAPYPGEQCYDGGSTTTGTAEQSGAYGKAVVLRDIRQLSNYLSALSTQEELTDNIVVTAFIDEYIYYYDPRTDPVSTYPTGTTYKGVTDLEEGDTDLRLWKRSVNSSERMMHIVKKGDMNYSWDGETSLSRSVVTIQQQPIISVYNHMAQSLNTAWGSEVVNETPKMVVSRTKYNNITTTNAYTEAQTLTAGNGSTKWASVISASEQYGLVGDYNDPSYACALRNRDLNGDGTINQNEVLWYLASLDQMTDMWIADPAMPADKKLYDEDNPDGYYSDPDANNVKTPATHYITSSLKGGNSPWVYWAEEYGATSTHDNARGWDKAPVLEENYYQGLRDPSLSKSIVSLRCVRNFGAPYTSTAVPQDFIVVQQPTSSADGTIDLKYINPDALRTAPDSGAALAYADLDDVGENNRPYAGFFVQNGSGTTWTNNNDTPWLEAYQGEVTGTDRVCPTGYRVPNQREMVLMTRAITSWTTNNYTDGYLMLNGQNITGRGGSKSFGEFYYYPHPQQNRIGRTLVDDSNEDGIGNGAYRSTITGGGGGSIYVRCVKDNPDAKPDVSGSFDDEGDDW